MKRKKSTVPTRVFKYGLPLGPDPECRALVDEQIRLGHEYRNDLVRVELDRREAYRTATAPLPSIAPIEEELAGVEEELASLLAQIKATKAEGAEQRARSPRTARTGQGVEGAAQGAQGRTQEGSRRGA